MKYKRVFCFGCSYTEYLWPTWANILEKDLDIPVYNWGLCGIGNVGIHARMLQCDLTHKFNEDDLIVVVWSSWTREDRWIDGYWKHYGNIFNNNFYDSAWMKKYWDWENDIIKNATAIISANKMFPICLNFSMVPMSNPVDIYIPDDVNPRTFSETNQTAMLDLYYNQMPEIKNFQDIPNSRFNGATRDSHPDINSHRDFLLQHLYPQLGISMKSSTMLDIEGFFHAGEIHFADVKKDNNEWENTKNCAKNLWTNGNWSRNRICNWDI